MTHGGALPEGFYEALLSVIREGYPGDMQELAHLQGDNPVDRKRETDAYLQEIVRVTLENSGIQFHE